MNGMQLDVMRAVRESGPVCIGRVTFWRAKFLLAFRRMTEHMENGLASLPDHPDLLIAASLRDKGVEDRRQAVALLKTWGAILRHAAAEISAGIAADEWVTEVQREHC
ncbi:MAG: hypothetical protein M3R02_06850 [Chloroflexota bacterium]|nr:hypothetical protein [Chloroflexota bacterium]